MRMCNICLFVMVSLLSACEVGEEEGKAIDPRLVSLQLGGQLDAESSTTTAIFSPFDANSYHLKSHFVVDPDIAESYLLWLYFAKTDINQWQVFAVYEDQLQASYKVLFSSDGKIDELATASENGGSVFAPFQFVLQAEVAETPVSLAMHELTQYGLDSEVYYITKSASVPSIHRIEPTVTSTFELAINIDSRATPLSPLLFNPDDNYTYNHASVGVVYDSMGVSHLLYFFFLKRSANVWDMHVAVQDNAESYPNDGWAELVSGESTFRLTFDLTGQLLMVGDADVSLTNATVLQGWSLESGATGSAADHFSFELGFIRITQWADGYYGTAEQDGGWL